MLKNENSDESAAKKTRPLQYIGNAPNQPNIVFKKTSFSGKVRNFQYKWFQDFPWLHYNEAEDKAYCFLCIKCIKEEISKKNFSKAIAFTHNGFGYWNKGQERFKLHAASEEHKEANCKISAQKSGPVDELLDQQCKNQRAINRKCLSKIVENVQFCALTNSPLQGNVLKNSFFRKLAELRANDDENFKKFVSKEKSYLSNKIQNEILDIMGQKLLHEQILKPIQQAPFFTIMSDETTDRSNTEQAVICLRTVNDKFEVREDFIGLYKLKSTKSEYIFNVLKEALLNFNLPLSKLRGQSYDGAANMSGVKNGVVTKFQEIEPRAVYIHCNGHLLNLATSDCVKDSTILKDTLSIAYEITKLVNLSPKRESKIEDIKMEIGDTSSKIKTFSATRWTVRAKSIKSILDNYTVLLEAFKQDVKDSNSMPIEMKSRFEGIVSNMKKFRTYFGLNLAYYVLRHTDILANNLQKQNLNAAQAYSMVKITIETLKEEKKDEKFEDFYKKSLKVLKN